VVELTVSRSGPVCVDSWFVFRPKVRTTKRLGVNCFRPLFALKWTAVANPGFPTVLTEIDWAYNNTPNQSIEAGATSSATPEPSSLTLALLAMGAGGVMAVRQRRCDTARASAVD
jgi:PEP-CTERM motif